MCVCVFLLGASAKNQVSRRCACGGLGLLPSISCIVRKDDGGRTGAFLCAEKKSACTVCVCSRQYLYYLLENQRREESETTTADRYTGRVIIMQVPVEIFIMASANLTHPPPAGLGGLIFCSAQLFLNAIANPPNAIHR